ncbi:MAG TPA: hypothetical protein VKT77_20250 [Chthonomonadaceae bacterium]|nr:hypothetical protein [Chthonomonadaceae bacterium]
MDWLLFGWGVALLMVAIVADAASRSQTAADDSDESGREEDGRETMEAPTTLSIQSMEPYANISVRRAG